MKNSKSQITNHKRGSPRALSRGFTLFVAMVVTGTLMLIATGIVTLAVKQSLISGSGRDSQLAFYAADTGLECALYWDVKNSSGITAFSPSTGTAINCNKDGNNSGNQWVVGGAAVSTFTITFAPEAACAVVTVTKQGDDTTIESRGYNTCAAGSSRRVERAVRVTYGPSSGDGSP